MSEQSHPAGSPKRRRAARRRRAEIRQALRSEFVVDPPRGLVARLRAHAQSVQELERARLASHTVKERRLAPAAAAAPAARRGAASR
jgi:hypothetical protein